MKNSESFEDRKNNKVPHLLFSETVSSNNFRVSSARLPTTKKSNIDFISSFLFTPNRLISPASNELLSKSARMLCNNSAFENMKGVKKHKLISTPDIFHEKYTDYLDLFRPSQSFHSAKYMDNSGVLNHAVKSYEIFKNSNNNASYVFNPFQHSSPSSPVKTPNTYNLFTSTYIKEPKDYNNNSNSAVSTPSSNRGLFNTSFSSPATPRSSPSSYDQKMLSFNNLHKLPRNPSCAQINLIFNQTMKSIKNFKENNSNYNNNIRLLLEGGKIDKKDYIRSHSAPNKANFDNNNNDLNSDSNKIKIPGSLYNYFLLNNSESLINNSLSLSPRRRAAVDNDDAKIGFFFFYFFFFFFPYFYFLIFFLIF
jgi:hypothetical protein